MKTAGKQDRWKDRWTEGRKNRWRDGRMEGQTQIHRSLPATAGVQLGWFGSKKYKTIFSQINEQLFK